MAQNQKTKLPPGQHAASKMIAMPPIGGSYPELKKEKWKLKVYGAVENPQEWTWDEFNQLGQENFMVDFHCVTGWSKLDQHFFGVDLKTIMGIVKPTPKANFVIFESADGYTTNIPLKEIKENLAFVALKMDNEDIKTEFGGPARSVVPYLYAYKSAKFLTGIKFSKQDELGFWEARGYHNHADPWQEERYSGN